jgi:hypothetical protein
MIEKHALQKKIGQLLLYFLIIVAIVYGLFRAYPLIVGPSVDVFTPIDDDIVASTTFKISGKATRAKTIEIQGRLVPINTEGFFDEILVADYPYTDIIIRATDFYGKSITKMIRVIPK